MEIANMAATFGGGEPMRGGESVRDTDTSLSRPLPDDKLAAMFFTRGPNPCRHR